MNLKNVNITYLLIFKILLPLTLIQRICGLGLKKIHTEIAIIYCKRKSVGKVEYTQPFVTFMRTD